jgi:hypothetical protein
MNWTCAQVEERLSDFLEGTLTSDEQAEFSRHAATCAGCTNLAAQVGGMLRRIQALEMVPEPTQLNSRILDATLGPRAQKSFGEKILDLIGVQAPEAKPETEAKPRRSFLDWLPAPTASPRFIRFAMSAVSVAATLVIVMSTFASSPGKLKKVSDLNPASFFESVDRHAHLFYARSVKFVNDLRVVYEIESRLRPENETPPSEDQQKSQGAPHPGRSANGGSILVAFILVPGGGRSLP